MRKTILAVVALTILIAATPVSAQLFGTWAGIGYGNCHPPGTTIYPWQTWEGKVYVPETGDIPVFEGKWKDADGNLGKFKGKMVPSPIPEERHFKGYWTWETMAGIAKGGEFHMVFYFLEGECTGTWTSIWPSSSIVGTMKGKKVD
ncbi:hypothetical protein JXM67_07620 [candidate division WOR-3 bacterium]|nr:hypothetical protein [candidate division WOR-3 bacterium]